MTIVSLYPSRRITRADMGDAWPLTVEEGILQLREGKHVLFHHGGQVYAVNGTAISARHWILDKPRYRPIDELWADAESLPGLDLRLKKNIGPLIKLGLALGEK